MRVMSIFKWFIFTLGLVHITYVASLTGPETLDCHRRLYTYRVVQSDGQGKQCWDTLSVWSCWGRCDSNEISDWRFPYKRSYHPVCIHAGRSKSVAKLRHCEEGVTPGTNRYVYLEADTCKCQTCSSTNTSCEGVSFHAPHTETFAVPSLEEGFVGENDIE